MLVEKEKALCNPINLRKLFSSKIQLKPKENFLSWDTLPMGKDDISLQGRLLARGISFQFVTVELKLFFDEMHLFSF